MPITLRPPVPHDAEPLSRICYRAFCAIADAHHFPHDFTSSDETLGLMHFVLNKPDVHGVVAEQDGQPLGSAFLWENGTIHGIGPVTVDPDQQNGSVGRRMMEDLLHRAEQNRVAGVRLVQAAYHGRSLALYAKLGFAVRESLACLQGAPLNITIPGRTVRTATEADLAACNGLCCHVHGHDRADELRGGFNEGTALVVEHDGRITGYTTGLGFVGHAVGRANDDVKALIGAASTFRGPGFLLPTHNAELFRWCLHHRLRIVQPMTLMSIGLYQQPTGAFMPSILY